mmetsp:Transcript_19501/g.30978  ORF Transcript_19501/g.30978 Transcript_19501/m.30978 type:complete len:207 (-) Transcript_19501:257-877(-)
MTRFTAIVTIASTSSSSSTTTTFRRTIIAHVALFSARVTCTATSASRTASSTSSATSTSSASSSTATAIVFLTNAACTFRSGHIDSAHFAVVLLFDVKLDELIRGQRFESFAIELRLVHEHIGATIIGRNESVSFLIRKEFGVTGLFLGCVVVAILLILIDIILVFVFNLILVRRWGIVVCGCGGFFFFLDTFLFLLFVLFLARDI